MVTDVLNNPEKYSSIKKEARKTIVDNYDLEKVCLPKQIECNAYHTQSNNLYERGENLTS